jgi:hypothetical protein
MPRSVHRNKGEEINLRDRKRQAEKRQAVTFIYRWRQTKRRDRQRQEETGSNIHWQTETGEER